LFHGTAKMVQRALEAEEKKVNRNNDKMKKESDERERKMDEERKRREALLNSKVPEEGRRLTKIAELRANMVRTCWSNTSSLTATLLFPF
jgi:Skp family chaperone for outer membrane proteins